MNLTCSAVSVGIDSQWVQLGHHLQVFHSELAVAVLRSLLVGRRIVPGLLDQLRHLLVGGVLVVPEEMDPSQSLVSTRVPDLQGADVAIRRQVQLLAIYVHASEVVQGLLNGVRCRRI